MLFIARLRRNSPLDRLWRSRAQQEGAIDDIVFRRAVSEEGDWFETDELKTDQIARLKNFTMVELVVAGIKPPVPAGGSA